MKSFLLGLTVVFFAGLAMACSCTDKGKACDGGCKSHKACAHKDGKSCEHKKGEKCACSEAKEGHEGHDDHDDHTH